MKRIAGSCSNREIMGNELLKKHGKTTFSCIKSCSIKLQYLKSFSGSRTGNRITRMIIVQRSEERRVGKECRSRRSTASGKKKEKGVERNGITARQQAWQRTTKQQSE